MEYHQEELFDIRLTTTGSAQIRRLSASTRLILLIGIAVCVVMMTNALLRAMMMRPEKYTAILPLYIQLRTQIWFTLVYGSLSICQLIFYFRFVNRIGRAVDKIDTAGFNDAFLYLNRSNLLAVINITATLFFSLLDFWTECIYYKMLHK